MIINLLDGNNPIIIEPDQKTILKKISNEILEKISFAYTIDDITSIRFNLKGNPPITNSLLVNVSLNLRESDDIINVMKDKLLLLNITDKTSPMGEKIGLSFMYFHQSQLISLLMCGDHDTNSEISFWYDFSNDEYVKWNHSNSYGSYGFIM